MSWTTSWSEGKILPCGTDYGMSIPPAVLAPASSASRPAITTSCGRMKRVHLTHQDLNATNALAIERIQPFKVPTTLENAYQDPVSSSDPIASPLISSHLISSPTRSLETRKSLPPALTVPESPDFTAPKPDTGSQRQVQASSPSVLRLPTNIPSHNIQPAAFAPSSQSPEAMLCRTYRVHAFLTFARLVRLWAIWIRRVEGHVSLSRWKASLK